MKFNYVIHDKCENVLGKLKEETVDLTFTSPPYFNAKEYSKYSTYEEYLNFIESVFVQIHRVMKEGRYVIINSSPYKLAENIINLYSYKGDVVLDPFLGSGTTANACLCRQRKIIGIEKEYSYYENFKNENTSLFDSSYIFLENFENYNLV